MAFLGFAQVDREGNINSSRFGKVITGCGGSIDISQNAKKVIYCGSFAVKSQQEIGPEGVQVSHPGKLPKFVNRVQQVSFSGRYALEKGQDVLYVTERAVFRLLPEGLTLTEIAPGIDLQRDILDVMEFQPRISPALKVMDSRIYKAGLLGLASNFKTYTNV